MTDFLRLQLPVSGEGRWPAAEPAHAEFAGYYDKHFAKLTRHLMRQGAQPHEAAEAAQAAFTEAFVQWETLQYPAAWLRKVALRQFLRRPAAREDFPLEFPDWPGGMCPLRTVELKEEEARVYAALSALPPLQRQVLAWELDGFTTAEIATELHQSPEAVRQNRKRGRERLKKMLLSETDGGRQ